MNNVKSDACSAPVDFDPIPVSCESEVARWTRGRSEGRTNPVEAIEADGRPEAVFVADQLLVDGRDRDLVNELVARYGAEVIPRKPLPPPPEGMGPRPGVVVEDMPLPVLLRVSHPPAVSKRAAELLRASLSRSVSATSESAARLAGLVAELAADGKGVGLNVLSTVTELPLRNPVDSTPPDPLQVVPYMGKARVVAAWQLVEVFREFRPTKPVTIGIFDTGFWLNGFDAGVVSGQAASDFSSPVAQLNLLDEGVSAGGASGIPTSGGFTSPWHGNKSASVAAAKVGNGLGASGVGGTVARPVLFKTDGSLDYYFRCLQVSLAWGLDVLNFSLTFTGPEFFFPTTAWDASFQYASDAGLIMVAGAGNSGKRIPEDCNPRPATRTPGTITVGALDGDLPWTDSNYGSSVNVWAPMNIPVVPDENSPSGSIFSGTSAAAPFVSGIMAMMRAVAPVGTLGPPRAKQLLEESGWRVPGRIGVDAYAAVLAAMGGRMPDDQSEAHATPQTARQLQPGAGGVLMPFRRPSDPRRDVLSSSTRSNWYKFEATTFSRFDLLLTSYATLGPVLVTLEPDDDSSRAVAEMTENRAPGFTHLIGLIAPGSYKVHVRGQLNMYQLAVSLADAPLPADEFERNDSFDTATRFQLREPGAAAGPFSLAHPAGTHDLSLHTPGDKDFFRIDSAVTNPLSIPVVRVSLSDLPIEVTLYDAARNAVASVAGKPSAKLTLPRTGTSFVKISGAGATRYRLTLRLEIDQSRLPGPNQVHELIPLPDLGYPPFRIDRVINHVLLQIDASRPAGVLALAAVEGQPMKVELLDGAGRVVRTALRREDSPYESVELDVRGLRPGAHVLRVAHADVRSSLTATPLNVQVLPSFA